jgi:hypothetical protein
VIEAPGLLVGDDESWPTMHPGEPLCVMHEVRKAYRLSKATHRWASVDSYASSPFRASRVRGHTIRMARFVSARRAARRQKGCE